MSSFQKGRLFRNQAYLKWIRKLPCTINLGHADPIQAAHLRLGSSAGIGIKPSDYRTLPLCARCHFLQHNIGERAFWDERGIDPEAVCISLMTAYLKDQKALMEVLEDQIERERQG